MSEIRKSLNDVPNLAKDLQEIRQESFEHSQLEMAMENMNNIFNINKNLEKAHSLINEGQLLHAHIVRLVLCVKSIYF
jgi:t-SNARE complex subunit (syntaxin)